LGRKKERIIIIMTKTIVFTMVMVKPNKNKCKNKYISKVGKRN